MRDGIDCQIIERSILITGGTSGLGLATARRLAAEPGTSVIVTGRHAASTAEAAQSIGARALRLDLGSLADVATAARRLRDMGVGQLASVVANAGMQVTRPTETVDGFEATFAINHLGHVALIARLLAADALAPGGRVVLVSSGTHDPDLRTGMPAPLEIDARRLSTPAPRDENVSESRRRYTTSKLANVMTAYALARRLSPTQIAVNAFDPGLMPGTGLARDAAAWERLAWRTLMRALIIRPGVSSPRRSGRTLAGLACGQRFEGVTGRYWSIDHERRSSIASYDTDAQDALWRDSLELVGLEDPTAGPLQPGGSAAAGQA